MQGTITRPAHGPAESPPAARKIKGISPNEWWFLQTVTVLLMAASAGNPWRVFREPWGKVFVKPARGIHVARHIGQDNQ
jgi:hypothetical protein